jgi:hypothetical protein
MKRSRTPKAPPGQDHRTKPTLFRRLPRCYRSNVADEFDSERFPGNFYQGMILKLDRARGRGVIRSHSGKEIPFEFPFVAVQGAGIGGTMPGINLIREGDIIGFDVGWTSKGLRVTTIHPSTAT